MFWRLETVSTTSTLATLMDKPDVTLKEIMDDEYILQEVKCGNKRLSDFLIKPENLEEMTKICVSEPEDSEDSQKKYKYCHAASEILAAGVDSLTDALSQNEPCFNILADFVSFNDQETRKPLNPLLASFFSKVFSLLITRHADKVLSFMRRQPKFLDNLVSNLGTSAIAESLYRLACGGEDEKHAKSMKSWLAETGFLSKLISQFDPSTSTDVHQNVAYLLCELIRTLRRDQLVREDDIAVESYVDPLVEQLESHSFVDSLLTRIFPGDDDSSKYSETVISNGCTVFLTLLQTMLNCQNPLNCVNEMGKYEPGQQDSLKEDEFARLARTVRVPGVTWEPDINRVTERCLASNLDRFKRLLQEHVQAPLLLPMGKIDIPLGSARLAVTQLLAQLLANGLSKTHEELVKHDLTRNLMDLFFKHKWNNFLHTNVVNCFICAFYGRLLSETSNISGVGEIEVDEFDEPIQPKQASYPSPLLKQLLEVHHILTVIVKNYEDSQRILKTPGSPVPPFIGHIMRLAVCLYYATQDGPNSRDIKEMIQKLPESERLAWTEFVNTQLLAYIKRNEPDQVGTIPTREDGVLTDHMEDIAAGLGSNSTENTGTTVLQSVADRVKNADKRNIKLESPAIATESTNIVKDEPMDQSGLGGHTGDEWAEKEITFQHSGAKISDIEMRDSIEKTLTGQRTSSSDEEEEKMDTDKSALQDEWFPSTSITKPNNTESENWANFDAWGSTTTTSTGWTQNSSSDKDNWANFDQVTQTTSSKPADSKKTNFEDSWPSNK